MQITQMPLEELKPAPYNPRIELKRTDPRYRKLRRSLQEFGLVEPLIWNRRTGHVVGGHQRLRILRELGFKEAPVSVVDLPPERERVLNIVLNNREAQSDYDVARLTAILEELDKTPTIDLRQTGFDPAHLEMLRQQLTPADDPRKMMRTPARPEMLEVILTVPADRLPTVQPEIDALLQRHGLESHVRWR